MHCGGSGGVAGFADLRADFTVRGLYRRGTEHRIYTRVMALRTAAKPLWFRGVRL
jgi:hypothetical protein